MHVALIREWFDRMHGGAERYAVALAEHLRARGHRVTVICDRWVEEDARGFEMLRVPFRRYLGPFAYERFAVETGTAAERCGADVTLALARSFGGDVCRVGDLLQQSWIEANWPDEHKRRSKLRWAWRVRRRLKLEQSIFSRPRYHRIVAISRMVQEQLFRHFNLTPAQVCVMHNGVDFGRFAPPDSARAAACRRALGLPEDALVALFVGMDFRRKGLGAVAAGFVHASRLAAPEIRKRLHLVAVGRGDEQLALRVSRELEYLGRVKVLPRTPRIEDCFSAADVLVHPSKADPGANVVLEALACGVPAVVSRYTGNADFIEPGQNGFVLRERQDTVETGEAILRLVNGRAGEFEAGRVRACSRLLSHGEHFQAMEALLLETAQARASVAS